MPENQTQQNSAQPITEGTRLYDDALKWMEQRQIVLPDVYYNQLTDLERLKAFSVARVTVLDELAKIHDSLMDAIDKGLTQKDWRDQLLSDPDLIETLKLSKGRLDNVFRTNIQHAYSAGIARQQEGERALKRRPFFQYDAINDSRTRPAHAAMDNYIARHGDPVWQRWTPICGYRCRCVRIALTEAQAVARGWTGQAKQVPSEPDDGFGVHPLADETHGVREAINERSKRTGPFWNNPKIQDQMLSILLDVNNK